MRWPLAALLGSLLLAPALAQEPNLPYLARITADDVQVRSGPGEDYYPTDRLKRGDEVEVYRHDPGGWCAIRPPKGSFSWVAGRHLQLQNDGLAKVIEDRVAARVGSRYSDVRDIIQVRLERGEVVEVLEAKRTAGSGSNTWYRIAPPSGEFRWVHSRYVDSEYSTNGLHKRNDPPRGDAPGRAGDEPADGETSGPTIPRRLNAQQFQKALDDLDLELSTMVVEEPTVWDFGDLRHRSQSLLNQAETAIERGRARLLVTKIARFEDIKARHQALGSLRQDTVRLDRQLSRMSQAARSLGDPEGRFDALGRLTQVAAPKPGAPQYAIMDSKGELRCYVSPAPGVNLRHYVGRDVGINGTRGYMPEQRAAHVMARNVIVVDGTTLR